MYMYIAVHVVDDATDLNNGVKILRIFVGVRDGYSLGASLPMCSL